MTEICTIKHGLSPIFSFHDHFRYELKIMCYIQLYSPQGST